ncbi:MAG: epimerase [Candidatus Lokiarchaeota archaeon]|nr:epimerase [Candidatus Lokiarchaeota archaeon]
MKVFIVGGTGFLGYYATLEFLKRGHQVDTISIPDIELGDWFPKDKVGVKYGNVFEMNHEELVELFKGYDAMVYAVGPDDRFTPDAPAYEFFHERLVVACGKVVEAARDAGVKRCAILNSYFAYFDRERPELHLAERHPYIKCRVEQAKLCIDIGGDKMDVMILELPYIFGTMPERVPLWKDVFVDRILGMKPWIFFFKGGSNMISVEHIAESIVGAIEQGKGGKCYPIGDENLNWKEWINIIQEAAGIKRRIVTLPTWIGTIVGWYLRRKDKKKGKEAGLNHKLLFKDIQCRELFFDPTPSQEELGFSGGGLKESIIETIKRCL